MSLVSDLASNSQAACAELDLETVRIQLRWLDRYSRMSIDWAALSARGGGALEDLTATCLVRRYPEATQTKPSQGDGGVDVSRPTDDGLEVWQIKNFTSPLTASQWKQVRRSLKRFWDEHVVPGDRIARYHLVTPWTSTREARATFEELTAAASFPTQWDGEAFLEGLVGQFQDTYERWLKGPDAMEHFTMAKAVIAGSPIEQGDFTSMLDALQTREGAIDALLERLSDEFYYDHGTFTSANGEAFPLPPSAGAVAHRVEALGNNRFRYVSAVPRQPGGFDSTISVRFNVDEGTPEADAVRNWLDWGVPFGEVSAVVESSGGPFPGTTEGMFSSRPGPQRTRPDLLFEALDATGSVTGRLRLQVIEATAGARTGWHRLVAVSESGMMRFEGRFAPGDIAHSKATFSLGELDGADPVGVVEELDALSGINSSDHVVVSIDAPVEGDKRLIGANHFKAPGVLAWVDRISRALVSLQPHANEALLMPKIEDVSQGEVVQLEEVATVYRDAPVTTTWQSEIVTLNDSSGLDVLDADGGIAIAIEPDLTLGNRTYHVDRPIVDSRATVRVADGVDRSRVEAGDEIEIVPGQDNTRIIAVATDWEREGGLD